MAEFVLPERLFEPGVRERYALLALRWIAARNASGMCRFGAAVALIWPAARLVAVERGLHLLTADQIRRAAEVYGTTVGWLSGLDPVGSTRPTRSVITRLGRSEEKHGA